MDRVDERKQWLDEQQIGQQRKFERVHQQAASSPVLEHHTSVLT
jgi:hypothetical protein